MQKQEEPQHNVERTEKEEVEKKVPQQNEEKKQEEEVQKEAKQGGPQAPESLEEVDFGDGNEQEEIEIERRVLQLKPKQPWKMRKPIERELECTRAQLRALEIMVSRRRFQKGEVVTAGGPPGAPLDSKTQLWVERWSQEVNGVRRYSEQWLEERQRDLLSCYGKWL